MAPFSTCADDFFPDTPENNNAVFQGRIVVRFWSNEFLGGEQQQQDVSKSTASPTGEARNAE
jgi:hypothetical protein